MDPSPSLVKPKFLVAADSVAAASCDEGTARSRENVSRPPPFAIDNMSEFCVYPMRADKR